MKTCKGCQQQKPFADFYRSKNNKDGYNNKCLICYRADYTKRRAKRIGIEPTPIEQQTINKAEILNVSKLFTNGKVTVRAKVKANHSLVDINWPCYSNSEADRYIDQLYKNPMRMVKVYLERVK